MRGVGSPPLSPSLSSAAGFSCGKQTSMAKRPRSFEEVVAALSPTERARIGRIDTFFDPNAERDEAEVSLAEDRDQPSEWRVEYFHTMGTSQFLRVRWQKSARETTLTRSNPGDWGSFARTAKADSQSGNRHLAV